MEEEQGRNTFEGYDIAEDNEVEKALEEYKSADEKLWDLTSKYLYPPEEVPHEGKRELVFPSSGARDEYAEVRRKAQEAREHYERIAHAKQEDSEKPS